MNQTQIDAIRKLREDNGGAEMKDITMAEYIDKEELLRELEQKIKVDNERQMAVVDRDFVDLVNDATVIGDVVEVVRCRDCVRYQAISDACGNCYMMTTIMHPDDYCSRGKGK